jgi:carbon-monoxide dehydrogenase medium subunit
MKPAAFRFHAPTTTDEALDLLVDLDGDAKPLAGGQSLVPLLALRLTRFDHLVDLNRVTDLVGVTDDGDTVTVGAMTRQAAVERNAIVRRSVPLLAEASRHIGHAAIRNRGTLGGSLAHGDPASEYPAVAIALGATLEIGSRQGRRSVAADDFFVGTWTTAVEADELLLAARYPVWGAGTGFSLTETARRTGDFAITGAACALQVSSDGSVSRAGLALMGMADRPLRARDAERALAGTRAADLTTDALAELAALAVADAAPTDDLHATARYRRTVGAAMVQDALARALATAVQES